MELPALPSELWVCVLSFPYQPTALLRIRAVCRLWLQILEEFSCLAIGGEQVTLGFVSLFPRLSKECHILIREVRDEVPLVRPPRLVGKMPNFPRFSSVQHLDLRLHLNSLSTHIPLLVQWVGASTRTLMLRAEDGYFERDYVSRFLMGYGHQTLIFCCIGEWTDPGFPLREPTSEAGNRDEGPEDQEGGNEYELDSLLFAIEYLPISQGYLDIDAWLTSDPIDKFQILHPGCRLYVRGIHWRYSNTEIRSRAKGIEIIPLGREETEIPQVVPSTGETEISVPPSTFHTERPIIPQVATGPPPFPLPSKREFWFRYQGKTEYDLIGFGK